MLGGLKILCVGKLSDDFLRKGCAHYEKRLSRYLKLVIHEVKDQPDTLPEEKVKRIEGEALLAKLSQDDHLIALAIHGKTYDSPSFSGHLCDLWDHSKRVVMVIGGSRGLSSEVLGRANETLSFSGMTFPHGLMRLLLLEQIYRACRIATNETYHK